MQLNTLSHYLVLKYEVMLRSMIVVFNRAFGYRIMPSFSAQFVEKQCIMGGGIFQPLI